MITDLSNMQPTGMSLILAACLRVATLHAQDATAIVRKADERASGRTSKGKISIWCSAASMM